MIDCKECKNYNICEIRKIVEGKLKLCQSFEKKNPKTNADRIRSMTDEELADFLDHGILDVCESFKCEECENRMNCDVCYLEWLKSEVKE